MKTLGPAVAIDDVCRGTTCLAGQEQISIGGLSKME